jgi:RNA-binding protein with serine-rich domain 1
MTNRGTAYIIYYDVADAEAAISHMHEAQIDGATLKVSIVLPRKTFSRSPPPLRRAALDDTRFGQGREPFNHGRQQLGPSRTSPPRRRSPRRFGGGRMADRHDVYRPRSISRSRSPRRSRSHSIRSSPGSPPRRRDSPHRDSSRRRRRRSPSYSSYSSVDSHSSYNDRSRSPSRSRGPRSVNRRR